MLVERFQGAHEANAVNQKNCDTNAFGAKSIEEGILSLWLLRHFQTSE